MLSMTSSRWALAVEIRSSRSSRWGDTPDRRIRYAIPVMALSGVRISWDMFCQERALRNVGGFGSILGPA